MGFREYLYPTRRKPLEYAAGALSVIVFIVGSIVFVRSMGGDAKQTFQEPTSTTTTDAPFDPSAFANSTLPTTVSPATVVESTTTTSIPESRRSSEGEFATPEDILRTYNVASSGLQQSVYDTATATAVALLKARITGEGANRYKAFIDNEVGLPPMDEFVIDGAYAEISKVNSAYVRTIVWWHGVQKYGKVSLTQAITGVFLAPSTLEPVPRGQLPRELQSDFLIDTVFIP